MLLDGKVWREGAYCATTSPAATLSESEQLSRYGAVHFEQLTKDEYEAGVNGRSVRTETKTKKQRTRAVKPTAAPIPAGVSVEGASSTTHTPASKLTAPEVTSTDEPPEPIEDYAELDIPTLLSHVAGMGDEGASLVLSYERATLNRPEVIKALETGEIPE